VKTVKDYYEAWKKGEMSIDEIAEILGLPRDMVYYELEALKLEEEEKEEEERDREEEEKKYAEIGRKIINYIYDWARRRGIPEEEIRNIDIEEVIRFALEKDLQFDSLVEYALSLEEELNKLREITTSPLVKMRYVTKLLINIIKFSAVARLLGIRDLRPFLGYYAMLIYSYLTQPPPTTQIGGVRPWRK